MPDDAKRSLMDQLESAVETMLRGEPVVLAPDPDLGALMGIASDLRDLPRQEFLATLAKNLGEEGQKMLAISHEVREGYRTVTPYVVLKQVKEMAEFLKQAFGAVPTLESPETGSGGGFHYEFRLGHSMLMVGGGGAHKGPDITPSLHYF
ncbi:MAG TPA: hypothetical protein VG897_04110, partial [Terriglobales bacterium]|nr:hypothetical protein [Terriglobales bacterium]